MSTAHDLVDHVRQAAEGTPYVVEERPYGFDLKINIVDAQWYTLLRKNGLERVFTHEVRLDESSQKLSITDVANTVRWDAGAGLSSPPSLHAEKSIKRGRVYQYSREVQVGVDAKTGQLGTPVNYSFNASEGRDLIRGAARELDWSEKMGGEQKGAAILVGAIVAVGVIFGLVMAVQALMG